MDKVPRKGRFRGGQEIAPRAVAGNLPGAAAAANCRHVRNQAWGRRLGLLCSFSWTATCTAAINRSGPSSEPTKLCA